MAITSNDAARLLRWPRESVMPAPDTAMQSLPGEAVRDAAIQPRLVLVFFASFLFTDAMRVSFTAAFYIMSLGVVLYAMLPFEFDWCWSSCGCCYLVFLCAWITTGSYVIAVGIMFCFPFLPSLASPSIDAEELQRRPSGRCCPRQALQCRSGLRACQRCHHVTSTGTGYLDHTVIY